MSGFCLNMLYNTRKSSGGLNLTLEPSGYAHWQLCIDIVHNWGNPTQFNASLDLSRPDSAAQSLSFFFFFFSLGWFLLAVKKT